MPLSRSHPVGSYLVTPLTKLTAAGLYAASVSIRRGAFDRVFRLERAFATETRALRYALLQGRRFVTRQQLA